MGILCSSFRLWSIGVVRDCGWIVGYLFIWVVLMKGRLCLLLVWLGLFFRRDKVVVVRLVVEVDGVILWLEEVDVVVLKFVWEVFVMLCMIEFFGKLWGGFVFSGCVL